MVISNHINKQYEEIYVKHLDIERKSTFIAFERKQNKSIDNNPSDSKFQIRKIISNSLK